MFGIERKAFLAIVMAAFGYFIDLFDLFIFSAVRVPSLTEIMGPGVSIQSASEMVLTAQMGGLLAGGFFWGVWADKAGRRAGLLGAGVIFTLATLASAFVQDPLTYALCRFMAGFGLSAEITLAFTLVGELVPPRRRGWFFAALALFGTLGIVTASVTSQLIGWRELYIFGAGLGAVIFLGRVLFIETPLFQRLAEKSHLRRGDLTRLLSNRALAWRCLASGLIGSSMVFASFFLAVFAPEILKGLGHPAPIPPPVAIFWYTIAICVADVAWAAAGQFLKSRRRVLALSMVVFTLYMAFFISPWAVHLSGRTLYFLLGLAVVPPVLWFGTMVEQFGTNWRATGSTLMANAMRGVLIPFLVAVVASLSGIVDYITAVRVAVALVVILSFVGLLGIRETFGADLEYEEADHRQAKP